MSHANHTCRFVLRDLAYSFLNSLYDFSNPNSISKCYGVPVEARHSLQIKEWVARVYPLESAYTKDRDVRRISQN